MFLLLRFRRYQWLYPTESLGAGKSTHRLLLPESARSHKSYANLSGNSGAPSEIFLLICSISSSRPALSISRMMACAANMADGVDDPSR